MDSLIELLSDISSFSVPIIKNWGINGEMYVNQSFIQNNKMINISNMQYVEHLIKYTNINSILYTKWRYTSGPYL